ncbi:hypothetical protein E2562_039441 [Oryza meyeriana var. granulata]|uniref:Apple domain-containing protein n=1 Tax=Oryza meyeriana var. granulata TaxID=110450 RepID=A0A6G1C1I8_9ORYZ|nr:hypothetical protein E2562_039441 [Oryza meyeriana var. granulata]
MATNDGDLYASCGPFSYCDVTLATPRCQCLDGSKSFSGCRIKQQLRCGDRNHFVTMPGMKVPDKFLHVRDRSFDACTAECSHNCSCTAYAYANLTAAAMADQATCLLWMGELADTGRTITGENLYLRLADSTGMELVERWKGRGFRGLDYSGELFA